MGQDYELPPIHGFLTSPLIPPELQNALVLKQPGGYWIVRGYQEKRRYLSQLYSTISMKFPVFLLCFSNSYIGLPKGYGSPLWFEPVKRHIQLRTAPSENYTWLAGNLTIYYWLVVEPHLWKKNMSQFGCLFPEWKDKKCSKPPTRIKIFAIQAFKPSFTIDIP